ncbi:MAG: response regulator [Myxococcota bacterium]
MKALVVDDSRAIRSILKGYLESMDIEVFDAADGKLALERLDQVGIVDIALVDWNMPHMNGLEFVEAVRAEREFDDMRIMMVTTETEIEQMTKALDAGANEYLMKPFGREEIEDKLAIMGIVE